MLFSSEQSRSSAVSGSACAGRLGFGAAAIGNLYQRVEAPVAQAAVAAALEAGIGYFDVAPHYGQGLAERRLGAGLAASAGGAQVIVSTKVGRVLKPIDPPPVGTLRHGFVDGDPYEPEFDYSYDGVLRSFEDSLKRLGRERIDILLAHDLGQVTHGDAHAQHYRDFMNGGYRAMCELKAQGLVQAIGLGVNEVAICEEVLQDADLDVVLLAGRYTLLEQSPLERFFPLCADRGVSVIAAAPFNSGILIEGPKQGAHYNYAPASQAIIERVSRLQAVCQAHAVPLAAAALQFPLAHPVVSRLLIGMGHASQVDANLSYARVVIPDAFWSDLKSEGLLPEGAPVPAPEVPAPEVVVARGGEL
ncbi:MAG: aldo/keto reductase [Asticcacaulis sp.]